MRSGVGAVWPRCRPPVDFFAPRLPDVFTPDLFAFTPDLLAADLLTPALPPADAPAELAPCVEVACDDLADVAPLALVLDEPLVVGDALVLEDTFASVLALCLVVTVWADGEAGTPSASVANTSTVMGSALYVIISSAESSSFRVEIIRCFASNHLRHCMQSIAEDFCHFLMKSWPQKMQRGISLYFQGNPSPFARFFTSGFPPGQHRAGTRSVRGRCPAYGAP